MLPANVLRAARSGTAQESRNDRTAQRAEARYGSWLVSTPLRECVTAFCVCTQGAVIVELQNCINSMQHRLDTLERGA